MVVTRIPLSETIGGAVRVFGEELGEALDKTVFAKGLKEKELRKEPSAMQGLVPAARAAQKGGLDTLAAFAKGLDVNVEFIDEILAFTPTREQAIDEAFLTGGGAEVAAASAISQSLFAGETAQAALDVGLPAIQASAIASQGQFDAANFEVQLNSLDFQVENGVIETRLKTEAIQAQIGLEAATATQEFFNGFDQSTEVGRRNAMEFAFALNNPAFLSHLALHEQMDFQASLALMGASQNPADKIELSIDLQDAWNTAVDRLRAAEEEGTDEFRDIAIADLNTVRLMIESANQSGLVFPIDTSIASLGPGFLGFGEKLELSRQIFDDPRAARLVVAVEEELRKIGSTDIADLGAEVLDQLEPRLREQVVRDFPVYIQALSEFESRDAREAVPGLVRAAAIAGAGQVLPGGAQAVGTGLEAISNLFNNLTEGLKSVLDSTAGFMKSQQDRARGR